MKVSAILSYKFKNIGSFGHEGAEVCFTTSTRDPKKELFREICGKNVNLVTAVMGANASGKTTLLKPIPFLSWFFSTIHSSLNEDILIQANKANLEAIEIEVVFIIDGITYKYNVRHFEDCILSENLYHKNENNIYTYIFKRNIDPDSFGEHIELLNDESLSREEQLKVIKYDYTEKHSIFQLGKKEGLRTPCNTSIIASARRLGVELATKIAVFFATGNFNITAWGRLPTAYDDLEEKLGILYKNKEIFNNVRKTLCQWDLGLSDIEIEEFKSKNDKGVEEVHYNFFGVHKNKDNEFSLPLYMESAGTQGALSRLVDIFMTLRSGTYAFIDKLGDDLHPNMIKPLIDLFIDKSTNPHGAQLVFSCHKPELINYLGKQRVYLCSKIDNESECYRIDDFPASDARSDENLAAKYLAGAFGGVPEL